MMGLARPALARVPGIGFWKLCGSGTGEGFTPKPNTGVYAILATWPDLATAQRQTAEASVFRRYARRAIECYTLFMQTTSARGAWSGVAHLTPPSPPAPARLRPSPAPRSSLLWRSVLAPRARHQHGHRRRSQRRLQDRHRRGAAFAPGHLLGLARHRGHGRLRPPRRSARARHKGRAGRQLVPRRTLRPVRHRRRPRHVAGRQTTSTPGVGA